MFKYKIKHYISEEEYDSLLFTHCNICKKRIIIDIPYERRHLRGCDIFTCNECIPESAFTRDGFNDSDLTDQSAVLWGDNL